MVNYPTKGGLKCSVHTLTQGQIKVKGPHKESISEVRNNLELCPCGYQVRWGGGGGTGRAMSVYDGATTGPDSSVEGCV